MSIDRRGLLWSGCVAALCAAALLALWKMERLAGTAAPEAGARPPRPGPADGRGSAGLAQVLAVCHRGGSARRIEQAIEFLDTAARTRKPLAAGHRQALIGAIGRGTPPGMAEGAWAHLFNSACNALAAGRPAADGPLLAMLEGIANRDRRLVLRLYALQHLGRHYPGADPAAQRRLRGMVQAMAADPDSPVAGTALVLWRAWEEDAPPGAVSSLEVSRAMAADPARPVDVRVTALHAMGEDPAVLEAARAIAANRAEPVILRKAALNLIGRHGAARDLEVLRECSRQSARLAQAGEPAARAVEDRLAGVRPPALHAY